MPGGCAVADQAGSAVETLVRVLGLEPMDDEDPPRWQRRRRQAALVDALLVDVVLDPDAHLGRPGHAAPWDGRGRRGLPARLGDEQTSAKLCCFESD